MLYLLAGGFASSGCIFRLIPATDSEGTRPPLADPSSEARWINQPKIDVDDLRPGLQDGGVDLPRERLATPNLGRDEFFRIYAGQFWGAPQRLGAGRPNRRGRPAACIVGLCAQS